ncbi:MAG: SCO family protein [Hyphomicrobiaceae bacterium]
MRLQIAIISLVGLLIGMAVAIALNPTIMHKVVGVSKNWSVGRAEIGGPFRLVDQDGQIVTENSYEGKSLLVFFGFTHCPDVCPAGLQLVSAAMKKLGPKADALQPIFVSLDPNRDTPRQLKLYLSNFDSRIVGLTGTDGQIASAAKAFRVYYRKVEDSDLSDGYTVDHSAFIYLIAPNHEFVTHFTHATPLDVLVARLDQAL